MMSSRTTIAVTIAVLGLACSSSTEPIRDIDAARTRWLLHRPAAYQVDVSVQASMFPKSPFHTAIVSGAEVVAVTDENGAPVTQSWAISVDSLWTQILRQRAEGTLNSATFDFRGVPLDVDWGPWALDGGIHYSLRNFTRR
jgi:hypothetical protein